MAVAMAGLIKKDQDSTICFLQETEPEYPVKWKLQKWVLDKDTVVLTKIKHLYEEPWQKTSSIEIKMGNRCIDPDLYGQDNPEQDSYPTDDSQ
jgi:hypothetical protein